VVEGDVGVLDDLVQGLQERQCFLQSAVLEQADHIRLRFDAAARPGQHPDGTVVDGDGRLPALGRVLGREVHHHRVVEALGARRAGAGRADGRVERLDRDAKDLRALGLGRHEGSIELNGECALVGEAYGARGPGAGGG
jgi:hypothetical protein